MIILGGEWFIDLLWKGGWELYFIINCIILVVILLLISVVSFKVILIFVDILVVVVIFFCNVYSSKLEYMLIIVLFNWENIK